MPDYVLVGGFGMKLKLTGGLLFYKDLGTWNGARGVCPIYHVEKITLPNAAYKARVVMRAPSKAS